MDMYLIKLFILKFDKLFYKQRQEKQNSNKFTIFTN